jgi:hypothetical protein
MSISKPPINRGFPVQIWPLTEPPFAIAVATVEYRIGDSHADSSLGGGALACTTAIKANLGAGRAPLGAATTIIESQPNHATVTDLSWTDSITEGEQNGVP